MTEQLRCELIRSATTVVCATSAVDQDRRKVAWEFLLREFRAAEAPTIEGYKKLTPEEEAEYQRGMAAVREATREREEKTLWDVSRDRREGVFSDPDVPEVRGTYQVAVGDRVFELPKGVVATTEGGKRVYYVPAAWDGSKYLDAARHIRLNDQDCDIKRAAN